jgi:mannose-6-phosphate isomerase-like protein (cupin superfamily)
MATTVTRDWLHNPATGELARVNTATGRRLDVDLWLQPGAAVAHPHFHPHLVERFDVLEGEVGMKVGENERTARPGAGVVEVPAGTAHDWWNAGDGVAHVHVEVVAADGAAGEPATRFRSMIEALWSLGALGKTNVKGVADALWMAALAREYRDAIRFTSPPATIQTVVLGPLAAIARRTGRDPLAPQLHAACAIADPGQDGLATILAQPVGAAAARGRQPR